MLKFDPISASYGLASMAIFDTYVLCQQTALSEFLIPSYVMLI